ncbi:hypothetical protein F4679DRAFT_544445 [Xylaria curta]|nr:hypothetical protein F4679DRAFT_544445 [Xylaria curta]
MAEIYRKCYITIAAASARDSKGKFGLHVPRRPGMTLTGTESSGKLYSIYVQYAIHSHTHIDEVTPNEGIQHPILLTTNIEHNYAGVFRSFPLSTRG